MRRLLIIVAILVALGWMLRREPPASTVSEEVRALVGPSPVVLIGAEWCGYCQQLKKDFKRHDIAFRELDVDHDELAVEAYEKLGGHGVPLTIVGTHVVHGYDPDEILGYARELPPAATR
jgi:glutaredoxin